MGAMTPEQSITVNLSSQLNMIDIARFMGFRKNGSAEVLPDKYSNVLLAQRTRKNIPSARLSLQSS
jgi:hypothetical protein